MVLPLPYGLAQHNYGLDALQFMPQRWITPADSKTAAASTAAVASDSAHDAPAATVRTAAAAAAPPDPFTFLTGARDW